MDGLKGAAPIENLIGEADGGVLVLLGLGGVGRICGAKNKLSKVTYKGILWTPQQLQKIAKTFSDDGLIKPVVTQCYVRHRCLGRQRAKYNLEMTYIIVV